MAVQKVAPRTSTAGMVAYSAQKAGTAGIPGRQAANDIFSACGFNVNCDGGNCDSFSAAAPSASSSAPTAAV